MLGERLNLQHLSDSVQTLTTFINQSSTVLYTGSDLVFTVHVSADALTPTCTMPADSVLTIKLAVSSSKFSMTTNGSVYICWPDDVTQTGQWLNCYRRPMWYRDVNKESVKSPYNWSFSHNDVIKWKHVPRYWPFVRGIHRSPVNSSHKGQWRGALMFSLIFALNKRLSKQSWGWWFETPWRLLWRHCNAGSIYHKSQCGIHNSSPLSTALSVIKPLQLSYAATRPKLVIMTSL